MNKQELMNLFIANLENERMKKGIKQYEMAQAIGMSLAGYRKMVSGQNESVTLYTAYVASLVLDMPLISLCGGINDRVSTIAALCRASETARNRVDYYLTQEEVFQKIYDNSPESQGKYLDVINLSQFFKDGAMFDSYYVRKEYIKNVFGESVQKAIRVSENYFAPTYVAGDLLLLNEEMARNGDITVIVHAQTRKMYIRKLYILDEYFECVPVNGRGDSFIIRQEERQNWVDCGHVVKVLHYT